MVVNVRVPFSVLLRLERHQVGFVGRSGEPPRKASDASAQRPGGRHRVDRQRLLRRLRQRIHPEHLLLDAEEEDAHRRKRSAGIIRN